MKPEMSKTLVLCVIYLLSMMTPLLQDGITHELGDIGSRDYSQTNTASEVLTLALVSDVSSKQNTVCSLLVNESLYCWGANNHGQVGINNQVRQSSPKYVAFGESVAFVGVGEEHSCAIGVSGTLKCWGPTPTAN